MIVVLFDADASVWNSTAPTSTEFSVGTTSMVNTGVTTENYVAYLFADNPDGGIKCGSDQLSGSTATVNTGFKSGWILFKITDGGGGGWMIFDAKRDDFNEILFPNLANEASTSAASMSVTDTGFTISDVGASQKFIYVAIADSTVLFYDEKALKTVTNHTLTKRYGVDPLKTDLRKFGIFPLTEQPTYSVDIFVKEGQAYKPVRNYTGELNRANITIDGLRSRLASLESDEINDDAVDNSLITLVGSLSSQVTTWKTKVEDAETALADAIQRIDNLENN